MVGLGLLMQGVGDALARNGHASEALVLFLGGITLHFAVCAWRLTGARAARNERIWVSVVLGLGLFASYVMLQPLLLDSFDELDHMGTLFRILDSRTLFPKNTDLPVSPYYPGLELATAATKWMTGLPLVVDQLVVLAVVRLVLVLGVFLVVERLCRSSRAGGIGALVYAASPQFYGFDAQYAYETIGLAFAVGSVYFLFFSIDAPRPRMGKAFLLALGSICAVVISHHVTGWLTIGFLVICFIGMVLTIPPLRRRLSSAGAGLTHGDGVSAILQRRKVQTGMFGVATAVGVIVCGAWTVYVFRLLSPYLGPIFSEAATEIRLALGNGHGDRTLFKSSAGGTSPHWEIGLILLAAAAWCIILLPALYSVIFKRSVRGGLLRWIPAVIAAIYPLTVVANVSSASKLVAERATTFVFFGMAVVVAAWLARRIARARGRIERFVTIALTTVVFVGSLLFGIGPPSSLLPGAYQVGADNLSYGSPSFALARWADTHLPAGSNIAADRDNGVLLNAVAGVNSATKPGGLINPELLYFDHELSLFDISLIRRADIRYLVVDDRLATGRPLYGTYIASGEPSSRLTLEQLNKFESYPFVKRIYDNGPIQVYDLTQLLPPSERAAPAGPPGGTWGFDVGIFVLAAVVGVLWTMRLRRRRSRAHKAHDGAHTALGALVTALLVGVFGAFLVRATHAPPETVALVALVLLLALALRPPSWRLPGWRRPPADASPVPAAGPEPPTAPPAAVNGDEPVRPVPDAVPFATPASGLGGEDRVLVGSTFYERREIRDVLAYLHVLADRSDDASLRRVLNVPKRGIGPKSVTRLSSWARQKKISLREALERAEEAGFRTTPLAGAVQLSMLLSELEPLVASLRPQDLVEQVLERTGYRASLAAQRRTEAANRLENLDELVRRAGAFADLDALFGAVAEDLAAQEAGVAPSLTPAPEGVVPVPPGPPEEPQEPETPWEAEELDRATFDPARDGASDRQPRVAVLWRWTGRRRVQVALGCLGVLLFVGGATAATAAALKDWTPPPELSVSTSSTGHSVAQVQLGSAGPVAAKVAITDRGRRLWSKDLAPTTGVQDVALPGAYLHKGSRVDLTSDGHLLRWVDGWVSEVPKLRSATPRSATAG